MRRAGRLRCGAPDVSKNDLARPEQRSAGLHAATQRHRYTDPCSSVPLQRDCLSPAGHHRQSTKIQVIVQSSIGNQRTFI